MYWTGDRDASCSVRACEVSPTTRPLNMTRTRFGFGAIVIGCPLGRSILASSGVRCLEGWTVPDRSWFYAVPPGRSRKSRSYMRMSASRNAITSGTGDDAEQPEHRDAPEQREEHESGVHFHLPSHRERLDHVVRERQQHPAPDADEDGRRHVACEPEQDRRRDPDDRGPDHGPERSHQRGGPRKTPRAPARNGESDRGQAA